MPEGRAFSFAAWAVPAQQNDERNKANTDNGTLAHLQPSPPLATQCLQRDVFTLTRESRGSNRAECKRDLQATYGLRYLSRLQQLLLKELGYPLLRRRASAAASCKRTASKVPRPFGPRAAERHVVWGRTWPYRRHPGSTQAVLLCVGLIKSRRNARAKQTRKSQADSHGRPTEHKRLLSQQRSEATIWPAIQ